MRFVEYIYQLYEGKKWSYVILFITCFSFAHIGSSHAREFIENDKGDNIPADFSKVLVIESRCQMFAYNADDTDKVHQFPLYTRQLESCAFDLYLKKNIFFSYYPGSILSIPPSKSDLHIPANFNYQGGLNNIYDIAIDFINKKLYMITINNKQESDKLLVVDMVTGRVGIVLTDLHLPNRIEVDPFAGILFIQQQTSILRANMDGTARVKIIKRNGISNLAIHRKSKTIYWTTPLGIKSSNYYTISARLVASIKRPIRSIAVIGEELFWVTTPYGLTQPESTVSRCKVRTFSTCDEKTIRTIPFDYPQTLKAYDFEELGNMIKEKSNPCDNIKPSCQHLCLLKKNGYSCACQVGYRLNNDMHTCQLENYEFLLYVQDNYAKGRIVGPATNDSMTFVDAIHPNGLVSKDKFVSFDYYHDSNYIFFTDNAPGKNKLYMKKLDNTYEQSTVHTYDRKVHSTAFDWISKNIYQLVSDGSLGYNCSVIVHHYPDLEAQGAKMGYTKELLTFPTDWMAGAIVVHPLRGHMFITVNSDTFKVGKIYQANLDGSNLKEYLTDVSLSGLAIDFQEDRLYWFDIDRTHLMRYDFDDSIGLQMFDISAVKNATSVSVSNDYVYVSNLTSIWQYDKKTGRNPSKVIESAETSQPKTIIGTKMYGASAQPICQENPCSTKNGGCQKFCFAVPQFGDRPYSNNDELLKRCGCEANERLSLDGISCGSELPHENFLEY